MRKMTIFRLSTLSYGTLFSFGTLLLVGLVSSNTQGQLEAEGQGPLPTIPAVIPTPDHDGVVYFEDHQGKRPTTINAALQEHLTRYLKNKRSPVAAVAAIDIKTGAIRALAQGQTTNLWGASGHSALHNGFPAASLFKTVVTAAAFEVGDLEAGDRLALHGGCANVRPSGVWMREKAAGRRNSMSLRRAYGQSCNGFYAKLAVNRLGLGVITNFANRFGWRTGIPTDFALGPSPFRPPTAANSSVHTVGRFAAGFGQVGISAVHAAWMMSVIGNDGVPLPLHIYADTPAPTPNTWSARLYSPETANRLRGILDSSVRGGTASSAFRRGKHRALRAVVGGKTGTLTGKSPAGLTTWFAGLAPLNDPEIAIAAVVMLEDKWFIKGTHLAAEAFWSYFDQKKKRAALEARLPAPIVRR